MPTRRLPKSGASRLKALKTAKDLKDSVPPPLVIPFTATTIARIDTIYPDYKLKVEAMEVALQEQTNVSGTVQDTRHLAEAFIASFFSALQYAVRRKTFAPSVRAFYGLAVSDENLPRIKSEADVNFWGGKAVSGEAARIAAGALQISAAAVFTSAIAGKVMGAPPAAIRAASPLTALPPQKLTSASDLIRGRFSSLTASP